MGWFDDQIKQRKQSDDEYFQEAFLGVAGAIMGKRLVYSLEEKEVAETAIDEILKFYHLKSKNEGIPSSVKTIEEQINYRMRPFGIMHREVYLDDEWYLSAVGPMLGTLKEDGSAVALIPGKLSGYKFLDIKTGEYTKVNKKTTKLLDREATCFYRPLPQEKLTILDLLKYMGSLFSVSDVVLYIGMMGICTLIGMIGPYTTKWLFSDIIESGKIRVLLALAIFIVCYTICNLMVGAYQTLINGRIGIKQDVAIQAAVMNRIMNLPATFFKDYGSGELSQRSSYVQNLCNILMNSIGTTALTSVFSLVYIGQIFTFAPALVVPSIIITLSTLLMTVIATLVQTRVSKKQMMLSTKESGILYSMITGITKIKLAGAEKRMFSRWAKIYSDGLMLQTNPPAIVKYINPISLAVSLIGNLVLYYLAIKSKVSVADYYAFNASYGMVASAFSSLVSVTTTIANIKPVLEMAKPILEAEPEVVEGKEIVTSISGGVELNNVSFRYEESTPMIVDDLSLKIKPGEYVAIVGKTGCGKSTLLRLMLGFEKPNRGAIYYDRKDVQRVDIQSLRKKIGVVMQNGKLFTGDIYSNIVISAPELTIDDAWQAAEMASIADDIRDMPMGMHTLISEGSGGISGGQKQRLMIARAIAPKPKILMFDEATSALDNITQKKVSEAIDSLKCTRIVIAHRLSTIQHCDRIIVLDKGKIIEEGKYEDLIKQNGFFAELVKRQRIDIEVNE